MPLNTSERDFLDSYYREVLDLEVGQAISRAREVGFKYNDFKDLWEAYHQAWDGDFANWGSEKPPIHDPVTPIPWNGTLELKARIEALKAELETGPDGAFDL